MSLRLNWPLFASSAARSSLPVPPVRYDTSPCTTGSLAWPSAVSPATSAIPMITVYLIAILLFVGQVPLSSRRHLSCRPTPRDRNGHPAFFPDRLTQLRSIDAFQEMMTLRELNRRAFEVRNALVNVLVHLDVDLSFTLAELD